jgi:energy-coupling factor transport system permease protein
VELTRNITLGVYLPGETFIHRLDPRLKIIAAGLLITLLLFIKSYQPYGIFLLFITAVILAAGIPVKYILIGLKPMLPVLILMWIFQLLLYSKPGAETIFSWWIFSATDAGLHMGNLITMRVLFLFTVTTILTLTTSIVSLTDGLEILLKPLQKVGIPTQELVMTMVIALRFVLILAEELDKIIKAQMARGVAFDRGNFIQKTKKLFPVFLPLFINAFRRAEELIVAMEARSYTGGKGRTKMKTLHMGRADLRAGLMMLTFSALIVYLIVTIKPLL